MQVVVGRIVRPHGVRGEAVVDPRTDLPQQRFAAGQVLLTDAGARLRVVSSRPHQKRWLLAFEGVDDRDAVDALRGIDLRVDVAGEQLDEPDVFADADLVGLRARSRAGDPLGVVRAVEHLPMHDLLVVVTADGREVLVPFAAAIVPRVEPSEGWLLVDPPPGLFDDEGTT